MKVYLIRENFRGEEQIIGIAKTREAVDKVISSHYDKYKTDVGQVWWEEWEMVE